MSKLVRDRIPEIIKSGGREPEIEHVSGEWLALALKDKLVEEACELRQTDNVYEELADVLEVVDAIVNFYGIDRQKLESVKSEKRDRAGGFSDGCVLKGEKHLAEGNLR